MRLHNNRPHPVANMTLAEAWDDASMNNNDFIIRIANSKKDSTSNLLFGMFQNFMMKHRIPNSEEGFEKSKNYFLTKLDAALSGNEEIEPEYSLNEFENIEYIRNLKKSDLLWSEPIKEE